MKAVRVCAVLALAALGMGGCTPNWAKGNGDVVLLMTAINNGNPLSSDVRISTGAVCADIVPVRLENHFKNPAITGSSFVNDYVVQRYEVHYVRSDGRSVEGVDVPYSITGNVAQEVINSADAVLNLEVVRRQAKLEPPLGNLKSGGGAFIVTMFADITLFASTTTGTVLNPVSGRMQIDFADFVDSDTTCPVVT